MRLRLRVFYVLIAAASWSITSCANAQSPDNGGPRVASVYWTTGDAVDRLDLAHLGRSIRGSHKADEARAIAVWRYVRQTMYHYPMRNENHADQLDAAKLVNVYGYSFCTQQAVAAAAIAQAAGLKARIIGVPGHGMYELFYDDRWHAFCTTAGFYVRTREQDRHIASMNELGSDPTLVTKACQEGRASHPFLPCAGGPEFLGEPEGTDQAPYALSYRYYDEAFFVAAAKDWNDLGEPNPSQYQAWVRLRGGESMRLDWDASEHFVPPLIADQFHPPRHLCGPKDRANPFFDQIAPYGREVGGKMVYRYPGTGQQVWKPALRNTDILRDFASAENVTVHEGSLRRRDSAVEGAVVELEMTGPYPYVAGELAGHTNLMSRSDRLVISGQGTDPQAAWTELHVAPAGAADFRIPLGDLTLPTRPVDPKRQRSFTHYRFRVRVELSGDATVSDLEIRANVQHNWAALPRLKPGDNLVDVKSQYDSMPKDVVFELAWSEGDQPRALKRRLHSTHDRFVANVRSPDRPRMRYVLLSRAK